MATTAQPSPAQSQPLPSPTARITLRAVCLWHLLSLDAPSVAALWTWFLAASNHIRLPATALLAMAIAVWMLYAADRLLDTRFLQNAADSAPFHLGLYEQLEPRHLFHYRHRRAFRGGLLLCSFLLVLLLPHLMPAAVRLYLLLGGLLVGYFILIHAPSNPSSSNPSSRSPHRIPKEFAVGIFFSAATFIPTIAREPALRPILLSAALLFALLCSLNCLFIYSWEHPRTAPYTHPATRLALRSLRSVTLAVTLLGLVLAALSWLSPRHLPPWPILAATTLSALLLLLLDHRHSSHRLPATPLRASADLCLLTPLLLLPFLHA